MTKRSSGYKTIFISELVSFIGMTYPAILAVILSSDRNIQVLEMVIWFILIALIVCSFVCSVVCLFKKCRDKFVSRIREINISIFGAIIIFTLLAFLIICLIFLEVSYCLLIGLIVEMGVCFVLCWKSYKVKKIENESERIKEVNGQKYYCNFILLLIYLGCSTFITWNTDQSFTPLVATNIINSILVILDYYLSDDILMTKVPTEEKDGKEEDSKKKNNKKKNNKKKNSEQEKSIIIASLLVILVMIISFILLLASLLLSNVKCMEFISYILFIFWVWAVINLAYQLFMDRRKKSDNTSKIKEQSEK